MPATTHREEPIASLTKEVDRFAERAVRALFGGLFDQLFGDVKREIDALRADASQMLTAEFNALRRRFKEMDAALQASLDRLSGKVDEVASGLATEAGEIKTVLQSVAQQIRDGQVGDAATRIDSIADRVGHSAPASVR